MKKLEKEKNDDVLSSKHYTFLSCRYTCSRRCFYSYSKGKVHALLGMNGAGKSTLLKIATGEIQPVVGDIKLILSLFPLLHRAMQKHGISFVTQEVDHGLIPGLSVLENVLIDHLAMQNKVLFSKSKLVALAKQHLQTVQVNLNVSEDVSNCSLHENNYFLSQELYLTIQITFY